MTKNGSVPRARGNPVTQARTKLGVAARWHPEDVEDARRELAVAKLEAAIERITAAAPPLTPAQREKLALLLRPGGEV